MKKITPEKLLKILVPILIVLTSLTYYKRYSTVDDPWFAEQSYWLLHEGVIRSEFFRGLLGWENQIFVSHKLFLAFGAGLMGLFGETLYVAKLAGLLPFIGLIFLLYRYLQQRKLPAISIYGVLFLLFSNTLLIKMSFENRPEMMLAALGFASYLLVQSAKKWTIFLAGILAGLAVLTHLNGIIYLLAGFMLLMINKEFRNAIIFGIAGTITSLFYFYDSWQANGFETWLYQFRHDPATQATFGLLPKLKVMLEFPSLFFKSPQEISSSVLLLVLCWLCRNRIKELPRNLRIYGLCLLVSFWLITKRATGMYQVLFLPTMFVLIIELLALSKFNLKQAKLLPISLIFYLTVGVVGIFQLIYRDISKPYLPEKYHELSNYLPKNSNGLVPITFFFNEYKNYNHLLSLGSLEFQTALFNHKKTDTEALLAWLPKQSLDFILVDYKNEQENEQDYFPKPKMPIKGFKITYFDGRYVIYRKENNE